MLHVSFIQNAIAVHESNGVDIIIALVLNDINPLGKQRMDLVLELKVRCVPFRDATTLSCILAIFLDNFYIHIHKSVCLLE